MGWPVSGSIVTPELVASTWPEEFANSRTSGLAAARRGDGKRDILPGLERYCEDVAGVAGRECPGDHGSLHRVDLHSRGVLNLCEVRAQVAAEGGTLGVSLVDGDGAQERPGSECLHARTRPKRDTIRPAGMRCLAYPPAPWTGPSSEPNDSKS